MSSEQWMGKARLLPWRLQGESATHLSAAGGCCVPQQYPASVSIFKASSTASGHPTLSLLSYLSHLFSFRGPICFSHLVLLPPSCEDPWGYVEPIQDNPA